MLELRFEGRGGQGVQVAAQILAAAFLRLGRRVQTFVAYDGERRGAPATAFLRVDDAPIHLRCGVERAHAAVVLDATLLAALPPDALHEAALVLVNAPGAPCGWAPGGARTVVVDAPALAHEAGLGPIVSTVMLGALAAALEEPPLDDLLAAVAEASPAGGDANVAACRAGHQAVVAERLGARRAG